MANDETEENDENTFQEIYVDMDDFEDNFPDAMHEQSAYDIVMSVVEEMGDELKKSC
jgi:hypothetical protein